MKRSNPRRPSSTRRMFRLSSKRNQMMSQNSQLKPLLSMEEYSLQRTNRIIKMGLTIQILFLLMCVWLVVLQPSGPSDPCLTTTHPPPNPSYPLNIGREHD